jgi:hypothetical protein
MERNTVARPRFWIVDSSLSDHPSADSHVPSALHRTRISKVAIESHSNVMNTGWQRKTWRESGRKEKQKEVTAVSQMVTGRRKCTGHPGEKPPPPLKQSHPEGNMWALGGGVTTHPYAPASGSKGGR